MSAVQIRDVPEAIRLVLVRAAAERDESLQVYLSGVLEREAHRVQNRELVSGYAAKRRTSASNDIGELIRQERAERQQQIMDAIDGRD